MAWESKRPCTIEGCERGVHARELCRKHYKRFMKAEKPPRKKRGVCSAAGCERTHHARGLCRAHYKRWLWGGCTETPIQVGSTRKLHFEPKECRIEGCERRSVANEMCNAHYLRWCYNRPMDPPIIERGAAAEETMFREGV